MIETPRARRGMVTSPHHLASQAGLKVLKDGGTAVEAAVATAACLAVVYPHMTGIGGDGFWLIAEPGRSPRAIDACGRAGAAADLNFYRSRGHERIPERGPLAANTVAGTVSGWQLALAMTEHLQKPLSREHLLETAIFYAENEIVVSRSQADLTASKAAELRDQPGFAKTYMPNNAAPSEGSLLSQPALARTLRALAKDGFESFYTGALARSIAADLADVGAPIAASDLANHKATETKPLSVAVRGATLYNTAPPTQGLASLLILGIFDRLGVAAGESFAHIHGLVEATKQAFLIRDKHVGDPGQMAMDASTFLSERVLKDLSGRVDMHRALAWPHVGQMGDTVWLGAIDDQGRAASFIQSIYYEYGSGVVLPGTGICWQNRGSSFRLATGVRNALLPGRKPFHTLNPAMAMFDDGRCMIYGTMGGEGQPQTQAAIFSRYGMFNLPLQRAVSAPRWLLGKTWGEESATLKLEDRFDPAIIERLKKAGHDVDVIESYSSAVGHAGAVLRHTNGVIEGAADPRSDGAVAAY
jgi:gamma-glutamyltranspeptidase